MAEQLNFDILAKDRASAGFVAAGRSASDASDSVLRLAKRLDEVSAKSVKARVGLDGDKEAQAKLDALDLKMLKVGRRLIDPKVSLDGALKASAELSALDIELDKLNAKAAQTTAVVGAGSGGLSGPSGMGALIAAGAALSPVLVTVGVGTAGIGLAAAGAVSPIVKAAGAAGGLRANMAKLDPEQRGLALSILGLGRQYDQFQKGLQPEVLSVFGKGIHLASDLMHDAQPVAAATGKAFGGVLDRVDAEFQSGTWQNFFTFMAKTAGPDVALLGGTLTDLLQVLPQILEDLQPLATGFLEDADGAIKLAGALVKIGDTEHELTQKANSSGGFLGILAHAAGQATDRLEPGIPIALKLGSGLQGMGSKASGPGKKGLNDIAAAAAPAATAVQRLNTQLEDLDGTLSNQSAQVGWKQAQIAATKAIDGGSKALDGNSSKQLANRALVINSTQSLLQLVQGEQKSGKSVGSMAGQLQNQITFLEKAHDKSAFMTQELGLLEKALRAVKSETVTIHVSGQGSYSIVAGSLPGNPGGQRHLTAAAGMLVSGGIAGKDSVPILAQRDELIVPVPIVQSGAVDHLRGFIPGFEAGGVAGRYSGSVAGMPPWVTAESSATVRAIEQATATAAAAGIKAATAAASGGGFPGGGGSSGPGAAAAQSYARSVLGAYGWGQSQFPALQALWNQESGWRWNADNPSSGAYGIPQSLPGSKMAAAGADWRTNPATQIRWGLGYIRDRYGSPVAAESHEQGFHWYAGGTRGAAPGWAVVGERGAELVRMRGGEDVVPAGPSAAVLGLRGYASGTLTAKQTAALAKTEQSAGLSIMNYYASPGTTAGIRAEETRYLKAIAKYFDGSSVKWRDKEVERQTGKLIDVGNQIKAMSSKIASARSYQQSVKSGLAPYADLSTTTLGGAMVGSTTVSAGASLQGQLGQKESNLKKFASVLKKLSAAKVDSSLIRQVVALGPDSGTAYGQEILAGGPSLIKALNSTESAISKTETSISRGAASSVYEGRYDVGKTWLASLNRQEKGLEDLFGKLGKKLGEEAGKWFSVPKKGRPKGFASGGVLREPVYGWGASGQQYTFGEAGPETITPGTSARRSGAVHGGPLMVINGVVIREEADLGILAQKLSFAVTRAGLG